MSEPSAIVHRVDHLVYAAPDLESAAARIANLLGADPVVGGQHPGRGTRNRLLSLGSRAYLEIVGPDPDQPAPATPRWFGIDALAAPRLVTWAASSVLGIDAEIDRARRGGVMLGPLGQGRRATPDGRMLSWRFSDPATLVGGGIVPFLIDWGSSPHPSAGIPSGGALIELRAEHPEPDDIRRLLEAMALDLRVSPASAPALVATIRTAHGPVELR